MQKLSNQPPKGTSDWDPQEFAIRKYIFDNWRKVCQDFGYLEYLTPIVESAEVYRAKSGEDVGGKELTVFSDRGGRELAIRPEMTPSITRMVSKDYESASKPIRLFSIANFFRNEKPQRGRNREFWQLNYDVFGADEIQADIEIVQMAVEIMNSFNPPEDSFIVYINNRELITTMINTYLEIDQIRIQDAVRIIDKFEKLGEEDFQKQLEEIGAKFKNREEFMGLLERDDSSMDLFRKRVEGNPGLQSLQQLGDGLEGLGYAEGGIIKWHPGLMRGFDYYDGNVFEVFDLSQDNNRSLFGGGRYNGLGELFGARSIPAVGAAPGDETLKIFLESWDIIPENLILKPEIYVPILDDHLTSECQRLAIELRKEYRVVMGLEPQRLSKALEYADKNEIPRVAILGEQEIQQGVYTLKQMSSGEEEQRQLPYEKQ